MATIENTAQAKDDFSVTRLDTSPFGVRIDGIDLNAELHDTQLRRLADLLFEHKVIVLTGQDIDDATYVRFGRRWGRPIDFFKDDHRDVQHRELIRVTNATTVPMEHRDGAVQWHNDSSYDEEPAAITMLYCLAAPDEGGETLFADNIAAYAALPDAMRERIAGAYAWHTMLGAPSIDGETIDKMVGPEWGKYRHPLVYRHPVIRDRAALYTSATAQSIDGMAFDEGRELIRDLRIHSFQPRFQGRYKLRKGDLILWDNLSVSHSATPIEYSDEPGKFRLLQRISTKGTPGFLAI